MFLMQIVQKFRLRSLVMTFYRLSQGSGQYKSSCIRLYVSRVLRAKDIIIQTKYVIDQQDIARTILYLTRNNLKISPRSLRSLVIIYVIS